MVTVTHSFNCALADDPKAAANGEILISHWNADHVVSGVRTTLTANTTFYFDAAGSDSNSGTALSPWLTLQHGMDTIASTIDGAGFNIRFSVGAGTFAGMTLKQSAYLNGLEVIGAGSARTTISPHTDLNGSHVFCCVNPLSYLFGFDKITLLQQTGVNAGNYVNILTPGVNAQSQDLAGDNPDLVFNTPDTGGGRLSGIIVTGQSTFFWAGAGLIQGSSGGFLSAAIDGVIEQFGGFTFAVGTQLTNLASAQYGGNIRTFGTLSFSGSYSGFGFVVGGGFLQLNGAEASVPASSSKLLVSATYSGLNNFLVGSQSAAIPDAVTDLPDDRKWGVFKDTGSGAVYLAYNDGGTIKTVQLTT